MTGHLPPEPCEPRQLSLHDRVAARSLAMHILIARKVEADPALLNRARANLERWSADQNPVPRWIEEWREILQRPWPEISAVITGQGQENDRLRTSGPFAGILTEEERREIFDKFKSNEFLQKTQTVKGEP